jgi:hypothetical protein
MPDLEFIGGHMDGAANMGGHCFRNGKRPNRLEIPTASVRKRSGLLVRRQAIYAYKGNDRYEFEEYAETPAEVRP